MRWYLPDRNPLLWDEMRRRLRGTRSLWLLFVYGMVLCGVLLGIFLTIPVAGNPLEWPKYGQKLWYVLLAGQGALLLVLAPGLAAGVITGARKQGTLEFLLLTALTSWQLIGGFFWGQLSLLLLMVVSSM